MFFSFGRQNLSGEKEKYQKVVPYQMKLLLQWKIWETSRWTPIRNILIFHKSILNFLNQPQVSIKLNSALFESAFDKNA